MTPKNKGNRRTALVEIVHLYATLAFHYPLARANLANVHLEPAVMASGRHSATFGFQHGKTAGFYHVNNGLRGVGGRTAGHKPLVVSPNKLGVRTKRLPGIQVAGCAICKPQEMAGQSRGANCRMYLKPANVSDVHYNHLLCAYSPGAIPNDIIQL